MYSLWLIFKFHARWRSRKKIDEGLALALPEFAERMGLAVEPGDRYESGFAYYFGNFGD